MTPRRGRGRPALFTDNAQAQYLSARAAGATQAKAAAAAGVAVRTVHDAYKRVAGFWEAEQHAAATARPPGPDPDTHGEGRYNRGCRCRVCRTKASQARAERRARAKRNTTRVQQEGAPVVPFQPPQAAPTAASRKAFLLARAS